jgi:hypothetical protein
MNTEIIHRLERSFVFDARELERARSLRESHRRFEEQTGPSEGISTVIDKLDRIIAALELQQPEDEEAPLSSSIQGPSRIRPDGEKK